MQMTLQQIVVVLYYLVEVVMIKLSFMKQLDKTGHLVKTLTCRLIR